MITHETRLTIMSAYYTTKTTQAELAKQYKVSTATISRILNSIEAQARYPTGRKRTRRPSTEEERKQREAKLHAQGVAEILQSPSMRATYRMNYKNWIEQYKDSDPWTSQQYQKLLDKLNAQYPDDT